MKLPLHEQIKILHWVIDKKHVRGWDLAVDVGAFEGQWACLMAEHFKKVIAFEPCWDNMRCWDVVPSNVTRHQKAVLDRACRVHMLDGEKKRIYSRYAMPSPYGDTEAVTIDGLGLKACDLLKIDVEGAELHVLRGAHHTINQFRPTLIIELKGGCSYRYDVSKEVIFEHLDSIGYRLLKSARPDMVYVPQ